MASLTERLKYWAALDAPFPQGMKNDCGLAVIEIERLRRSIFAMMEAEMDSDGNAVQTIGKTALDGAER
jgi:hypothetical protein